MCECYNKCINRVVVIIIIIIIVLLFYFILQNNSKITILTFMNVGVFAFSQLLFWQKPAGRVHLFVDNSRFINVVFRTYRIVACL